MAILISQYYYECLAKNNARIFPGPPCTRRKSRTSTRWTNCTTTPPNRSSAGTTRNGRTSTTTTTTTTTWTWRRRRRTRRGTATARTSSRKRSRPTSSRGGRSSGKPTANWTSWTSQSVLYAIGVVYPSLCIYLALSLGFTCIYIRWWYGWDRESPRLPFGGSRLCLLLFKTI